MTISQIELSKGVDELLLYAFSSQLRNNKEWTKIIHGSIGHMIDFMSANGSEISTKSVLQYLSTVSKPIMGLSRKSEENFCIEAVILYVYISLKQPLSCNMEMVDFEAQYSDIINFDEMDKSELQNLLKFRNVCAATMQLIPPMNNKEHILELVTRFCEGYSVRRITGSGMTVETRIRYEILHREGQLERHPRPYRRHPNDSSSLISASGKRNVSVIQPSISASGRKRGRPRKVRAQDSFRAAVTQDFGAEGVHSENRDTVPEVLSSTTTATESENIETQFEIPNNELVYVNDFLDEFNFNEFDQFDIVS